MLNEGDTKSFSEHSNQAKTKIRFIMCAGEQNYSANSFCTKRHPDKNKSLIESAL
jgi:hypothetical protein